jgi:hypothetical protein
VEARVAEHPLLLEAVAGERVDARRIVGKHLGLDAMEAQRIHRVGNQEPRRLHSPARRRADAFTTAVSRKAIPEVRPIP